MVIDTKICQDPTAEIVRATLDAMVALDELRDLLACPWHDEPDDGLVAAMVGELVDRVAELGRVADEQRAAS